VRAAALLGVLAAVLGGCFWWQAGTGGAQVVAFSESAPAAEEAPDRAAGETIAPPGEDASAGPEGIEVHVAGAVLRPGVVQLPSGSRLYEAILAAGGATDKADPDRLNLAAVLEDGQKVLVPIRGEPDQADAPTGGSPAPGSAAGGMGPGSDGGGGKINLNTASLEELGTLPRVGPVLAQRIVDWRQQHGRFKTVQELDAVDGIGPKLLEALLPLVGI
jgi:competence protein ComEA